MKENYELIAQRINEEETTLIELFNNITDDIQGEIIKLAIQKRVQKYCAESSKLDRRIKENLDRTREELYKIFI